MGNNAVPKKRVQATIRNYERYSATRLRQSQYYTEEEMRTIRARIGASVLRDTFNIEMPNAMTISELLAELARRLETP